MTAHTPDHPLLTPEARAFLADVHRRFEGRRRELLARRVERQRRFDAGERPDFLPETAHIRADDWRVDPIPFPDLADRRVEITGPTERKMMINALNSGARCFMADLEDATTPTWENVIDGHQNLVDAHRGTISLTQGDTVYELGRAPATLMVRPRGWHLDEAHVLVDGEVMSGSLFDAALHAFHNLAHRHGEGLGLYLYLPKLESHLEARLWNDVFDHLEDTIGVPRGTIRATVLVETILAAFEMDEILFELRTHAAGLNAGRWDYIFSMIKTLGADPAFVLPDRARVTMTTGFMRAYTTRLVTTCLRRGAAPIGGMSAFIPNRRDPVVTERALAQVRADKTREATDGFVGTWVAHPDLVEVALAAFEEAEAQPSGDLPGADALLDVTIADAAITDEGLRLNVDVGIRYLAVWLAGSGAVAINNLMEDAATAEISRSQIWQWLRHGAVTGDGRPVTRQRVEEAIGDVVGVLTETFGDDLPVAEAADLFASLVFSSDFEPFLTIPAYRLLTQETRP